MSLTFELPDGKRVTTDVTTLLNAGYAGRRQDDVAKHVRELARLGVPAPATTPSLYPVPPYLAMQTGEVFAHHDRTSGEGEWAIVVAGPADDDILLTAACDHTDRALEVHGIAWAKQAGPDVLGRRAWRLATSSHTSTRSSSPPGRTDARFSAERSRICCRRRTG